jgi:hypothetical protein
MKLRIFWLAAIIPICSILLAQGNATLSGRIFDQSVNQPLAYATVTLKRLPDSVLAAGTLTDAEGRFSFTGLKKGNVVVSASYIGYSVVTVPLLIGELNNYYDVGRIELVPSTEELDAAVISAKKAAISADLDKKTYRIEDNLIQSGGSVLDFMKALPGITVDQEGKVLLRGNDKVAVLIDGKQSSLTGFGNQKGLDNIPADNLENIEIINNPSAKYDASGMAGIINITYKKEKSSGIHGDVGFTYGLGQLVKRKPDVPSDMGSYSLNPKYIPSLSVNYKKGKLNSFLQGEMMKLMKLPNNEFSTRSYEDGSQTISQVPENRKQTHYILKGGMDLEMNDHNKLSFSMVYDYEDHQDTAQVPYLELVNNYRYRNWGWLEYEITGYMNYSLQYRHKFNEPGHELSAGLQYTKGWEDESYFLTDSSEYRQSRDTTHLIATEHTSILNIDYVRPMKYGRIETGAKIQIRRIPVTYTTGEGENSIIYPGLGDWSDWGENIFAGYVNYIYEKPLFDVEAGIRAENTLIYYDLDSANIYYLKNDKYSYFRLFPNIRLTLKINEKNSLSAFYNRRIDRPGEPEVRVFPKYDDPELLKVGNPYLRPQLTQSFELAYKYRWKNGSFFISGYHRITDDPYTRIYSIDTTNQYYNIVNKIYQNTAGSTNTGLELVMGQNIKGNLKLTGSFNWYNNMIKSFEGTLLFPYERTFSIEKTSDNTWNMKLNCQYTLPWHMQVQLSGIYYAPINIPQGRQLARSSVDFGLKQSLLQGKGEFTFSFSDIFNHFGISQEISGNGVLVLYENYYETQIITVGFRYRY